MLDEVGDPRGAIVLKTGTAFYPDADGGGSKVRHDLGGHDEAILQLLLLNVHSTLGSLRCLQTAILTTGADDDQHDDMTRLCQRGIV